MAEGVVVHVTTVHPPTDTRIALKECASLARLGFGVSLVAVPRGRRPATVRLVPINGYSGRLARMTLGVMAALVASLRTKGELFHLHDPELLPLIPIFRLLGKRVVYDAHEKLAAQILTKPYLPGFVQPLLSRVVGLIERLCLTWADGVVAATPAIARQFQHPVTAVVQNMPITDELVPDEASAYAQRDRRVVYVGGLTRIRGAMQMLRAMEMTDGTTELVVAGSVSPASLRAEFLASPAASRVKLLGWRSRSEVAALLATARVGLVVLEPAPNHVDSQPTKLFEYMSVGIPVLASDFPGWRKLIDDVGCGIVVDPCDPSAITQAIDWLLEHPLEAEAMGSRGRRAVRERFNWAHEEEKLAKLYSKVLR